MFEYSDNVVEDYLDNADYDISYITENRNVKKLNPFIAKDYETLEEHYTILLDYTKELEEKLLKIKSKLDLYKRKYYYAIDNISKDSESYMKDLTNIKIELLEKEIQDYKLLLLDSIDKYEKKKER